MSKTVLLTTLHLSGFNQAGSTGTGAQPINLRELVNQREDITVELKILDRFEVNAIVGTVDGKQCCPVWVIDYKATMQDSQGAADVWRLSVILDETYHSYEKAHDALVEIVDHLMSEAESPTSLSDLKLASI